MSAEVAESPVKRIKVRHRGNRAMLAKIETMLSKAHFQEIREMYREDIRKAKEEAGLKAKEEANPKAQEEADRMTKEKGDQKAKREADLRDGTLVVQHESSPPSQSQ